MARATNRCPPCSPRGRRASETLEAWPAAPPYAAMYSDYQYEYTDTFGGDANYSWVDRGTVRAKSMRSAIRKAREAVGLTGVKGRAEDWGGNYAFRPYGSATILFVNEDY